MHRKVTSEDVEDYSSHVPGDVVALDREEDIEYKKGVMTHSSGVSTIKMMPEVNQLYMLDGSKTVTVFIHFCYIYIFWLK